MHQITQLQRKVNSVAKSCVTPEQKASARRFYHLYKAVLKRYNEDFGYQVKVDMIMLTLISLIIAMGAGLTVLYLFSKAVTD